MDRGPQTARRHRYLGAARSRRVWRRRAPLAQSRHGKNERPPYVTLGFAARKAPPRSRAAKRNTDFVHTQDGRTHLLISDVTPNPPGRQGRRVTCGQESGCGDRGLAGALPDRRHGHEGDPRDGRQDLAGPGTDRPGDRAPPSQPPCRRLPGHALRPGSAIDHSTKIAALGASSILLYLAVTSACSGRSCAGGRAGRHLGDTRARSAGFKFAWLFENACSGGRPPSGRVEMKII